MLKVLVNSYTCCPGMGSEQGMGWHWITNLAHYCELFVITEGEYRFQIEEWLSKKENEDIAKRLHFYWNPIGGDDQKRCEKIRKTCWNQGNWRFYLYYKKWQKSTADIAERICGEHKIDILHQLNMIGFREPGYLWKVSQKTGIPFIWGPIDAKEAFPMAYTKDASFKVKLYFALKNVVTKYQLRFGKRVHSAANQASFVIGASGNSVVSIKKYFNKEALLINETGCQLKQTFDTNKPAKDTFDILWVGKTDFRKLLRLALTSFAKVKRDNLRLHIVGGGNLLPFKKIAEQLGIADKCTWHGVVSHSEVQDLMRFCDVLLFTSVAEGTPHVVMEAIGNGLPVICFDTCGQADCVNEKVGIKLPLSNLQQSANDFSEAIEKLYTDADLLSYFSNNCHERQKELCWDNKTKQMLDLYKSALSLS